MEETSIICGFTKKLEISVREGIFEFIKLNFIYFEGIIMVTKIFTMYTLTVLLFLLESFYSESVDFP